ncbi:hypothetical protein [Paenibacillus hexagrammi]|uniref:Uncharacterized protein n=1 Tax=Paenibacillus hexagrammi TaxID=2908839 RepID=A0ABY3SC89_9BACL|nr:hypothetical protein [Paenibacillus sp. YPD9-1]UJF31397.1 hypothetical protein L0M14_16320 [Paenibacillus sp. YPD9-1]
MSFKGALGEPVTTQLSITVTKLTELLENGGFENGQSPWTVNDTANLSVSGIKFYIADRTVCMLPAERQLAPDLSNPLTEK